MFIIRLHNENKYLWYLLKVKKLLHNEYKFQF